MLRILGSGRAVPITHALMSAVGGVGGGDSRGCAASRRPDSAADVLRRAIAHVESLLDRLDERGPRISVVASGDAGPEVRPAVAATRDVATGRPARRATDVGGSGGRGAARRSADVHGAEGRSADVRGADVRGSGDRSADVRGSGGRAATPPRREPRPLRLIFRNIDG